MSPKSAEPNVQMLPSNIPLLNEDPAGNVMTLTITPVVEEEAASLADRRIGTGTSSVPPRDEIVRTGGSTGGVSVCRNIVLCQYNMMSTSYCQIHTYMMMLTNHMFYST